jgi:ribosomal 50S subunit-recycling heat shock protein
MRIDKYLKVARIIKRRAVAQQACDAGRVLIGDKVVKAGDRVKIGDIVTVRTGDRLCRYEVTSLVESTKKDDAVTLFKTLEAENEGRHRV